MSACTSTEAGFPFSVKEIGMGVLEGHQGVRVTDGPVKLDDGSVCGRRTDLSPVDSGPFLGFAVGFHFRTYFLSVLGPTSAP